MGPLVDELEHFCVGDFASEIVDDDDLLSVVSVPPAFITDWKNEVGRWVVSFERQMGFPSPGRAV
jgi:hypothetical protein